MQTTMLWTVGVFSTTTSFSDWRPTKPCSATALVPSSSSRCLNAGSTQARATILAPLRGPTFVS